MKKALIGAGGFADEVKAHLQIYDDVPCFVDDIYFEENNKNIRKLSEFDPLEYEVLIAVGDSESRKKIADRLPKNTKFFTFIHPTATILGDDVEFGEGTIICAGSIITTNCKIGKHAHINLQTTVGHDCLIGDFFTTAPGAKVSGNCIIGDCVYLGTNTSVKQKIEICDCVIVGLNSGVVKNIKESGVYIGTPAKKIS
jgi:sugar O-acyltransferase (sialic acid O-acetyltransferase NeuD family)